MGPVARPWPLGEVPVNILHDYLMSPESRHLTAVLTEFIESI